MSHIQFEGFVSINLFGLFVRSEPNKRNILTNRPSTMASALPHQPAVEHTPRKQTDVVVNADGKTGILQSLSSETAQAILGILHDEPGTASDIADAVDTSLQNAHYHLDKLSESGLVEPVDTWYSEKGKEMTVYALSTEELVIQFGIDHEERAGRSEG